MALLAKETRQSPAKSEELLVGEPPERDQKNSSGEEKPHRSPELREHSVPGALLWRRILNRQKHCAAPLAAKSESLSEAAKRRKQRRRKSYRLVRRQRANRNRGYAHGRQRHDERRLCGRRDRRNARTELSQSAALERQYQMSSSQRRQRVAEAGSDFRKKQAGERRAQPQSHRCKSQRTRWSFQSGSRKAHWRGELMGVLEVL